MYRDRTTLDRENFIILWRILIETTQKCFKNIWETENVPNAQTHEWMFLVHPYIKILAHPLREHRSRERRKLWFSRFFLQEKPENARFCPEFGQNREPRPPPYTWRLGIFSGPNAGLFGSRPLKSPIRVGVGCRKPWFGFHELHFCGEFEDLSGPVEAGRNSIWEAWSEVQVFVSVPASAGR